MSAASTTSSVQTLMMGDNSDNMTAVISITSTDTDILPSLEELLEEESWRTPCEKTESTIDEELLRDLEAFIKEEGHEEEQREPPPTSTPPGSTNSQSISTPRITRKSVPPIYSDTNTTIKTPSTPPSSPPYSPPPAKTRRLSEISQIKSPDDPPRKRASTETLSDITIENNTPKSPKNPDPTDHNIPIPNGLYCLGGAHVTERNCPACGSGQMLNKDSTPCCAQLICKKCALYKRSKCLSCCIFCTTVTNHGLITTFSATPNFL